ncbi:GIY-YIG nuclease family protein [Agaribacterium sp. ZY112]|uniref:GIY-YIG nuclease family protein n=1 Tax=Agaribacterium sp. ZY112 TaxID=3233574 RepID=UPI0035262401
MPHKQKPQTSFKNDNEQTNTWQVYIVSCSDNSLYCGITTDLERRLKEHNGFSKGARYTRARQPVNLVYSETLENRSQASIREAQIKKLSRAAKLALIKQAQT